MVPTMILIKPMTDNQAAISMTNFSKCVIEGRLIVLLFIIVPL